MIKLLDILREIKVSPINRLTAVESHRHTPGKDGKPGLIFYEIKELDNIIFYPNRDNTKLGSWNDAGNETEMKLDSLNIPYKNEGNLLMIDIKYFKFEK